MARLFGVLQLRVLRHETSLGGFDEVSVHWRERAPLSIIDPNEDPDAVGSRVIDEIHNLDLVLPSVFRDLFRVDDAPVGATFQLCIALRPQPFHTAFGDCCRLRPIHE